MTIANDIDLIRQTVNSLVELSYETGYYAGKAESGEAIDVQLQKQVIDTRNRVKIALLGLIQSTIESVIRK